jgi:hypothetical protein
VAIANFWLAALTFDSTPVITRPSFSCSDFVALRNRSASSASRASARHALTAVFEWAFMLRPIASTVEVISLILAFVASMAAMAPSWSPRMSMTTRGFVMMGHPPASAVPRGALSRCDRARY